MSKVTILTPAITLVFLSGLILHAQMQAPKPAPELKKAEYFAGTWKLDGDIKPGPMGPGGKMAMTEECRWMEANFFMVCHSKFSSATMGSGSGISVMGYDSENKTYTYDEFNSMGQAEHSTGTFSDDIWAWGSNEKMNGKSYKARFVIKAKSPGSYTFEYGISPDGDTWVTVMDGKATKVQ